MYYYGCPSVDFWGWSTTRIFMRMLGSDRFPYSPTKVEALDVRRALSRIDAHFAVVGVFELFEHSAALIAVLAGVPVDPADLVRVRAQHTPKYAEFTPTLKGDRRWPRVLEKNVHDQTLHREASGPSGRQLRENSIYWSCRGARIPLPRRRGRFVPACSAVRYYRSTVCRAARLGGWTTSFSTSPPCQLAAGRASRTAAHDDQDM